MLDARDVSILTSAGTGLDARVDDDLIVEVVLKNSEPLASAFGSVTFK